MTFDNLKVVKETFLRITKEMCIRDSLYSVTFLYCLLILNTEIENKNDIVLRLIGMKVSVNSVTCFCFSCEDSDGDCAGISDSDHF